MSYVAVKVPCGCWIAAIDDTTEPAADVQAFRQRYEAEGCEVYWVSHPSADRCVHENPDGGERGMMAKPDWFPDNPYAYPMPAFKGTEMERRRCEKAWREGAWECYTVMQQNIHVERDAALERLRPAFQETHEVPPDIDLAVTVLRRQHHMLLEITKMIYRWFVQQRSTLDEEAIEARVTEALEDVLGREQFRQFVRSVRPREESSP